MSPRFVRFDPLCGWRSLQGRRREGIRRMLIGWHGAGTMPPVLDARLDSRLGPRLDHRDGQCTLDQAVFSKQRQHVFMKILVVDDHPVVAYSCKSLFASDASVKIEEAADEVSGHRAYLTKK